MRSDGASVLLRPGFGFFRPRLTVQRAAVSLCAVLAGRSGRIWRTVADHLGSRPPKLATPMEDAEEDVLAYMSLPTAHRAKLHSTNPVKRLNGEIKRRTEVIGILPSEAAITRLVVAHLQEQNDECAVQCCRYMTLETISPDSDDPIVSLPKLVG